MSRCKPTKAEQTASDIAKDRLREWMPKGSTVYTILETVSKSGMRRTIRLVVLVNGEAEPYPIHPNYNAALVLGRTQATKGDGIVCNGCGMDMGFDLVYSLSCSLYGEGDALKHRWL